MYFHFTRERTATNIVNSDLKNGLLGESCELDKIYFVCSLQTATLFFSISFRIGFFKVMNYISRRKNNKKSKSHTSFNVTKCHKDLRRRKRN